MCGSCCGGAQLREQLAGPGFGDPLDVPVGETEVRSPAAMDSPLARYHQSRGVLDWSHVQSEFVEVEQEPIDLAGLPPEDRWILARLSNTIRRTNQQLLTYQFSPCINDLPEFFWDSLCEWYIELTKARRGAVGGRSDPPETSPPPAATCPSETKNSSDASAARWTRVIE